VSACGFALGVEDALVLSVTDLLFLSFLCCSVLHILFLEKSGICGHYRMQYCRMGCNFVCSAECSVVRLTERRWERRCGIGEGEWEWCVEKVREEREREREREKEESGCREWGKGPEKGDERFGLQSGRASSTSLSPAARASPPTQNHALTASAMRIRPSTS